MLIVTDNRKLQKLRIKFWYEHVSSSFPNKNTLELAKVFEPIKYRDKTEENLKRYHSEKWVAYRSGSRKPQKKLRDQVDEKVRGSNALFNHPLWDALAGNYDPNLFLDRIAAHFSVEIQDIIYRYWKRAETSQNFLALSLLSRLRLFNRRANLDSLTVLSILFIFSIKYFDRAISYRIGLALRRTLLIFCSFMPNLNLSDELIGFYVSNVFPLLNVDRTRDEPLESIDFETAINFLKIEVKNISFLEPQRDLRLIAFDLLDGKLGFKPLSKICRRPLDVTDFYLDRNKIA